MSEFSESMRDGVRKSFLVVSRSFAFMKYLQYICSYK